MTGIHAAVGGFSFHCHPDPFEDNDSKLCAACGEYKRDVDDYNMGEVLVPLCETCLLAGQEAVAEIESEIDRIFPHWIEVSA